jgi:integrase
VFPATRGKGHLVRPTNALAELKEDAGVPTFMFHGIRHTLRARLARLGVAPHIAELVLGHALHGMESQYVGTGVTFLAEMREALNRWTECLGDILSREAAREGA